MPVLVYYSKIIFRKYIKERSENGLTNIFKTDKSIAVIAGLWLPFPNSKGRFGIDNNTIFLAKHRERLVSS